MTTRVRKILSAISAGTLLLTMALSTPVRASDTPAQPVTQQGQAKSERYLVGIKRASDLDSVQQSYAARIDTVHHKFHAVPVMAVEMTAEAAATVKQDSRVAFVEADATASTKETTPWGVQVVKADVVQASGITGSGVKVALIDTGVGQNVDLTGVQQVAFGNLPADGDQNGHGTHVAGTIAARVNGIGLIGVAPDAQLYSLKALDASGNGYYSDIIASLEWAMDHGIQVVNMSFAGSQSSQAFQQAVSAAYQQGMLLVAAAGNQGGSTGLDTIQYPAAFPEVIAVGAVNQQNQRASFSSTGAKLELMAPGVQILSTLPNNLTGEMSGTSMAAPHVTGVAALVWSHKTSLKNTDVRAILSESATPLGDATLYGNGLLNAQSAVSASDLPPGTWKQKDHGTPPSPASPPSHGPKDHNSPTPQPPLQSLLKQPLHPLTARADVTIASSASSWGQYAPPTPDLWANYMDNNTIGLSWSNQGANWFELDKWNFSTNQWDVAYTGSNTSFTDTNLSSVYRGPYGDVSYCVWAQSVDGTWSGMSYNGGHVGVFLSTSYTGTQVPYSVRTSANSNTVIVPPSAGVWFSFWRAKKTGDNGTWGPWTLVQDGTNNQYTDTSSDLTPNSCCVAYNVWVQRSDGSWYSNDGNGGEALVDQPAATPANLQTTSVGSSSVTLAWAGQTSSIGDGSVAYHCLVNGEDLVTTESTSCTISTLAPDTAYTLSVFAINGYGGKSASASITIKTGNGNTSGYQLTDLMVNQAYMGGSQARVYPTGTYQNQYWIRTFANQPIPSTWVSGRDYLIDGQTLLVSTAALSPYMSFSITSNGIAANVTDSSVLAMSQPATGVADRVNQCTGTKPYCIVLAAGMLTWDGYFDDLITLLNNKYGSGNIDIAVSYPYGELKKQPNGQDPTSGQVASLAIGQLASIEFDATHVASTQDCLVDTNDFGVYPISNCTIGGHDVRSKIGSNIQGTTKLILIGHSGGGVAVVRGEELWKSQNCCLVNRANVTMFSVGSPSQYLATEHDLDHYIISTADPVPSLLNYFGRFNPASYDYVYLSAKPDCCGFNIHAAYFDANQSSLISGQSDLQQTWNTLVKYLP